MCGDRHVQRASRGPPPPPATPPTKPPPLSAAAVSMAERVSGFGDAHTRAESLDRSGPAVCRWSEWHEMRAVALWRMRVAVMKLTGSKAALALADGTRRPRCRWLRRRRLIIFALPVLFDAHWHEPSMVAMELVLVAEAPCSLGAPSRSRAHDKLPVVTCVAGVGRADGCKAHCKQAAFECGDVHSTRHGGRRPGMAERVPGCGNAHTRAEPHDVLASILRVALVV